MHAPLRSHRDCSRDSRQTNCLDFGISSEACEYCLGAARRAAHHLEVPRQCPGGEALRDRRRLGKDHGCAVFTFNRQHWSLSQSAFPRVLWAGIDSGPELAALASQIEETLNPLGFAREKRAFSPDVTLARFKSSGNRLALAELLSGHASE